MKKRIIILSVSIIFILSLFFAVTVMAGTITQEQLDNINNSDVMDEVSKIVLEDTGNKETFSGEKAGKIEVYVEDVTGDGDKDAIISVYYGPKYNITALYKNTGNGYEYAGKIGDFFSPQTVKIKNFKDDERIVFLSDYTNQKIGAFEEVTYLYGYKLYKEEKKFKNVFTEPMNIEAQWIDEGVWHKVVRKGAATYENGTVPVIRAKFKQQYYTIEDDGSKKAPASEAYRLVEEWETGENYYWSDDWERFIITEKTEKSTGENVAVLSRWEKFPYVKVPELEKYNNVERIIRKDGTSEPVDKNDLREIEIKSFYEIKKSDC